MRSLHFVELMNQELVMRATRIVATMLCKQWISRHFPILNIFDTAAPAYCMGGTCRACFELKGPCD